MDLSQLALRSDSSASKPKPLIESTKKLFQVLQKRCRQDEGVFDDKLADYVFFPLSQILRRKQAYNDTLSELTIKCLGILLEYGWRKSIPLDLAKQLLILLTFVAGGVPGQVSAPVPEELLAESYGALSALFRDVGVSPGGPDSLVEAGTVPALGHCMTVLLDGIKDGPSADVQVKALQALASVWRCIKDQLALSTFLPGTISALTKCLMPSAASRRSRRTIVIALEVLEQVLVSILSDIRTRNIRDGVQTSTAIPISHAEEKTLTKPWLKATTGQIKLALSNIVKLRTHESMEVRRALNKLCITMLDECHDTLADSSSMLVETCMTLSKTEVEDDVTSGTTLVALATVYLDLGEIIQRIVYNWTTSLPRVMQSNDETVKHTALSQLSEAHGLLTSLNLGTSILEDALASSLRDSITVMLESPRTDRISEATEFGLDNHEALIIASDHALPEDFPPVVMPQESQRQTRLDIQELLDNLSSKQFQINMASEMLDYVRGASGPGLLSAYWLSSQLLRSATSRNKDFDEFFTKALTVSDDQEILQNELFSFSLLFLSNVVEEEQDWRLQAVALEVIATTAQNVGEGFRTELVDTIYPIVQFLGSPNPNLRRHAIICLDIVSNVCGYGNVSNLIVDNVDYIVNAISLRLNTFDISPQAPQVLVMMIRLAGPSLLLYLDDVIGSIFAALDNFHGYHRLVELLFSVLGEIVDVGSKSGRLQITSQTTTMTHQRTPLVVPAISDIIKAIEKEQSPEDAPDPKNGFPTKPWRDGDALLGEAESSVGDEETGQNELPPEVSKLPPTKPYAMVQSIVRLGQHYLTNQSPTLRAKLLGLVSTACVALQSNEDEFLPLINDIWPVVVGRLYDDEPFVTIAAADAIAEICKSGGDFMATRIQAEWSNIMKMMWQARTRLLAEKTGSRGRGIYSQPSQIWEAVVRLLIAMVQNVRVDDEMFDEILELLVYLVSSREDVRDALYSINADAVWLAVQMKERIRGIEEPVLDGYAFTTLP